MFSLVAVCVLAMHVGHTTSAFDTTCRRFPEIYKDGTELCETMWGEAFQVVDDTSSKAFTMWFFDQNNNPNDKVAEALNQPQPDVCHLQYFHKDAPGPEPDNFTECHPWKENSCCHTTTVMSAETIKRSYGPEFHWDRCGTMTPACERFFVQEACFYECEPHAGSYRRYNASVFNASDPSHNKWELYKMPIKKSYCDAWFQACRQDFFCGDGNYFQCAKVYSEHDKQAIIKEVEVEKKVDVPYLAPGAVVAIVVCSAVAAFLCIGLVYLVGQEKSGKPLFSPLLHPTDGSQSPATAQA